MRLYIKITGRLILLLLAVGWFWSLGLLAVNIQSGTTARQQTFVQDAFLRDLFRLPAPPKSKLPPGPNIALLSLEPMQPITVAILGTIIIPAKPPVAYWPVRPNIDCKVMRCVALTFDDGPSSSTLALISILQSKKAVATFFVVGSRVNRYQPALQQMIANNDEIGNHSFSHVSFKKISSQSVANEVNSTQNAVFVITGYRPHIVRPPDGDIPANDPTLAKYPIILWSIDPDDWKTRNTDTTYSRVMASVQPGSIIIMHDLYPATINAVPRIIDSLQQQGYVLVTISELFGWKDASVPLPIGQVLHHQQ